MSTPLPPRPPAAFPGTFPGAIVAAVRRRAEVVASQDAFRLMIGALMVLTISRIHQHFGFLKPFRPALLLVGMAGMYALANPKMLVTGSVLSRWPTRMMAYLGVAACLSVPFGLSMGASAAYILDEYSKVLIFAILVVAAIRHVRDLYTMVWAYVIGCAFLAWLSIFVFKLQTGRNDDFSRIQTGYSYDSNDLGLVILIGLVFTLMLFQLSQAKGKMFSLAMMGAIGITIARTGSRGTFLGLAVVVLVLLVLLRDISAGRKMGFVALLSLGVVVAAPQGYWAQMLTILNPSEDYNVTSTTGRWQVWKRGMGYLSDNPVTGIGINNFGRAEGLYSPMAENKEFDPSAAGIKWSTAHNSFVQALVETGLVGGGLFIALVFGGIVQMFKLRRRLPPAWSKGDPEQRFLYSMSNYMPAALMAFAVSGSLISFAWIDPVYVLAAFMSGLYVSVERKLAEEAEGLTGSGEVAAAPARRVGRGGHGYVFPAPSGAPPVAPSLVQPRRR